MERNCFVGLDVGRYEISVCIIDSSRDPLSTFSISQTHCGYQKLLTKLKELRDQELTPIVASEGHCGNLAPLDEYLKEEGFLFKPVHPTAVRRHKDYLGQPQKTDAYDALVIADFLYFSHQKTAQLPSNKLSAELKSLSRTIKSLTKTQTRFLNQLQAELMSYFPELLNEPVFSTLSGNAALHLLKSYPTPCAIANCSVEQLASFLAHYSRNRLSAETAVALIEKAKQVNRTPFDIESKALIVSSLAHQILSLKQSIAKLKRQLEAKTESNSTLQRLCSIPGISSVLASRLMGEIVCFTRFATPAKLAMFCGLAPVSVDSGRQTNRHRTTHRTNKVAKDALMTAAACSARTNPCSKTYYQRKRSEGKGHWHAIKCLARQLVRVIWAMWRDQKPYCPAQC